MLVNGKCYGVFKYYGIVVTALFLPGLRDASFCGIVIMLIRSESNQNQNIII